jgi:hypothetical protein
VISYSIFISLLYLSSFIYTVNVMLSPVYFLVPALLFFSFRLHKVKVPYVCILILIMIFILGRGLPYAYLVNTFLGGLCLLVAVSSKTEVYPSVKTIKIFNIFLVGLFILETYLRYSILASGGVEKYFELKYNSFMFADSNTTGFAIFSVLVVELYLIKERLRNTKIILVVLCCLLILTLSKTIVFFSTIMYFYHFRPKWIKYLIAFSIIALIQYDFEYVLMDPSISVRSEMFLHFFNYLDQASVFNLLFGAGWLDFRYDLYGDEPHSLIMSILGVGGIISFLVVLCLFGYIYIHSKRYCKFYFSTIVFSSFVFLPYYGLIFIHLTYAVLYLLERDNSYA